MIALEVVRVKVGSTVVVAIVQLVLILEGVPIIVAAVKVVVVVLVEIAAVVLVVMVVLMVQLYCSGTDAG